MIRKTESHTADQPMTLRGKTTEQLQSEDIRKTITIITALFKTRKDTKYRIKNKDQLKHYPYKQCKQTNNESTTTETPS